MAYEFQLVVIAGPTVDANEIPELFDNDPNVTKEFSIASRKQILIKSAGPIVSSSGNDSALNAGILHKISSQHILGNNENEVAEHIGLIYAQRWGGSGNPLLLGLMFDYHGMNEGYGIMNRGSNNIPREAAAVFLDPFKIHFATQKNNKYIMDALYNTSLHEIGHLFNLEHDNKVGSYMTEGFYKARSFVSWHCDQLRMAGQGNRNYIRHLPGMSDFGYGSNGDDFAAHDTAKIIHTSRSLALSIKLHEHEIIPGQPLVLEVTLTNNSKRPIHIKPRLDFGYTDMQLWYETPEGEWRLYRPILTYCDDDASLVTIPPGKSMTHNPRIHLCNRGQTFLMAGEYCLQVRFKARMGQRVVGLESNEAFFVMRLPRNDQQRHCSHVLMHSEVAFFVAHKGGAVPRRAWKALKELAHRRANNDCVKHARYALAKFHHHQHRNKLAADYAHRLTMKQSSLQEGLENLREKLG